MRIFGTHTRGLAALGVLAIFVATAACGASTGGGGGGTSPTPPSGGSTNTTTITIARNAVSPKNITIARGSQVTFVNSDTQPHDMDSDPHPEHTDCPEINQVGFIVPGQSRQTAPLLVARTCGFHDHNQSVVESLWGTITIQ